MCTCICECICSYKSMANWLTWHMDQGSHHHFCCPYIANKMIRSRELDLPEWKQFYINYHWLTRCLTMNIAITEAKTPQKTFSSVSIQQLLQYQITQLLLLINIDTHKSSCPNWSWATPAVMTTIGIGIPIEMHM